MLKEIHEGHKAIAQTLPKQLSFAGPGRDFRLEAVRQARRVILTACGSSFHAALIGEQLFARLGKVPARAVLASELGTVQPVLDGELVVAVTQSGETADVLSAVKKARAAGCKTLAVVNVPGSTATRVCDYALFTNAGPEISVAATKTFLAQLTAMYLLALSCSSISGKTLSGYLQSLKFLPTKVDQVLLDEAVIAGHAARLAKYSNAFYVARGINYPIAMEGALKLKEVSYIHAEAYAAGELKHGAFALLGPEMPVVALAPHDETYAEVQTSMKEIKARGAPLFAVVDASDVEAAQIADVAIRVPPVDPLLTPVVNTVVVQLLAYYAARARGCSIDHPVNLAKSVTVP